MERGWDMRRVKFRAWDKQDGCWYQPVHELYSEEFFELMVGFNGDLVANTCSGLEHQSLWPHRFELMQYTGMKDKNGKEVYEGDIIEYSTNKWKAVVQWRTDCASYEMVEKDADGAIIAAMNIYYVPVGGEVIGNIHENPELISKTT